MALITIIHGGVKQLQIRTPLPLYELKLSIIFKGISKL